MLKIRNAKPLFAVTVLLAPWDILLFVRSGGWGFTFPFGRFVVHPTGIQLLDPVSLAVAYLSLGSRGVLGLAVTSVWILCTLVVVLGASYTVYGRVTNGGTSVDEDRKVGMAFIAAGSVFLLSRLVVTFGEYLVWRSVPIGVLYVLFVGVVFYYGLFRLGPRRPGNEQ